MRSPNEFKDILIEGRKIFCSDNFRRTDKEVPSDSECEYEYAKNYSRLCDLRMNSFAKDICGGACLYDCCGSFEVEVRYFLDSVISRMEREKLWDDLGEVIIAEILSAFSDRDVGIVGYLTDIMGSDAFTLPLLRVVPGSERSLGKWESYRKVRDWMMKAYAHGYIPCAIGENERGPVLFITDFSAEE